MKKKVIILLLLLLGIRVYAQDQNYLIVSMTGGDADIILLENKPTIFYKKVSDDDYWLIISGTENVLFEYIYPLEMIKELVFSEDASGVNDITQNTSRYKISSDGKNVHIMGITDHEPINVYDLNGILLPLDISYEEESVTLSFPSVSKGVYVISISNKEKFKISIK